MNELIQIQNNQPTVPGVGVAGTVMCPYFRSPCFKNGCEMWVELKYGEQTVGRCSLAWQSILLTELRMEIEKAREHLK